MAGASVGASGAAAGGAESNYTDAELYQMCQKMLVQDCGERAPDTRDECTDEQLSVCTEYFEKLASIQLACEQDPEEIGDAELNACCPHVEDYDSDFWEHMECIFVMNEDEYMCETLELCAPGVDIINEDSNVSAIGADNQYEQGAESNARTETEEETSDTDDKKEEQNADDGEDDEDDDSGCTVVSRIGSGSQSPITSLVFLLGLVFSALTIRLRR
jgi:hypothetical protein